MQARLPKRNKQREKNPLPNHERALTEKYKSLHSGRQTIHRQIALPQLNNYTMAISNNIS